MKKLLIILIISLISQLSQANERFIPLELFTGGEIRDDTEIKFTKANYGNSNTKKAPMKGHTAIPDTQNCSWIQKVIIGIIK